MAYYEGNREGKNILGTIRQVFPCHQFYMTELRFHRESDFLCDKGIKHVYYLNHRFKRISFFKILNHLDFRFTPCQELIGNTFNIFLKLIDN